MKIAILLSCCFLSLADHKLKYNSTSITPGQTFTAVVELDGQQILHWDSNTMEMVPDTEWMKKVSLSENDHWNTETEFMKEENDDLNTLLPKIMNHTQQSEGVHSLSQIHGCQINKENETGLGFKQFNYDQEEFFSLNLTTVTWTPANAKAQKFLNEEKWDENGEADRWKIKLEVDCINSLRLYVKYSMSHDPPEAEVFEPHRSSPDLERQNLRDGVSSGMIVGGVVGGLLVLVLVLVIVGMVWWKKKKNSEYKQASSESDPEGGDSASNGS